MSELNMDRLQEFIDGRLDDPNYDVNTRQYKPGYMPPKKPIIRSFPTPRLPSLTNLQATSSKHEKTESEPDAIHAKSMQQQMELFDALSGAMKVTPDVGYTSRLPSISSYSSPASRR